MKRKKINTTRFALLGLLSLGPRSGYDLKKLVEGSIAHFWSESYGQIYPTLRRLEAERLVTRRREAGRGRPDRQVYALAPAGRRELERWLALPARFEPPRSELVLRMFFGGRVAVDASRRQIEAFRAQHQHLLERYDQVERNLRARYGTHPDLGWWLITLSFGRHRSRAFLDWCQETQRTLNRFEAGSRKGRPAKRKKRATTR
ncbi:MAG: PadR family transcriptional regulator [Terriglobales bacterium]